MRSCIATSTRSARFGCSSRCAQPSGRSLRCLVVSKLVLTPTGAGTTTHLNGESADAPLPILLANGLYQVGRVGNGPNNITIPIPTVSSRHALIRIEGDFVSVTDLGSTNGTVVDGLELAPNVETMLAVGGEVTFGDEFLARFQLCKEEAGDPSAASTPAAAAAAPPAPAAPAAAAVSSNNSSE
ncbi:MAG: hypothetical protein WDW36_003497 [Sanguina aurantia]